MAANEIPEPGQDAFADGGMLNIATVTKYRSAIMAMQKWEVTVPSGYTKPVVTPSGENMGLDLTKTLPPLVNNIAWLDGILVTYRTPAILVS